MIRTKCRTAGYSTLTCCVLESADQPRASLSRACGMMLGMLAFLVPGVKLEATCEGVCAAFAYAIRIGSGLLFAMWIKAHITPNTSRLQSTLPKSQAWNKNFPIRWRRVWIKGSSVLSCSCSQCSDSHQACWRNSPVFHSRTLTSFFFCFPHSCPNPVRQLSDTHCRKEILFFPTVLPWMERCTITSQMQLA